MQTRPLTLSLELHPRNKTVLRGVIASAEPDADEERIVLFEGSEPLEIWSALQDVGEALGVKVQISPSARAVCREALADFMEAIK